MNLTPNGTLTPRGQNPDLDRKRDESRLRSYTARATRKDLIAHALAFERAATEMLAEFREARITEKEKEGTCEPGAREEAANARKADAGCLFSLVKAWDASLERWRVLKGAPLPGSRRPTDPPPKIAKPKNRVMDTTAN